MNFNMWSGTQMAVIGKKDSIADPIITSSTTVFSLLVEEHQRSVGCLQAKAEAKLHKVQEHADLERKAKAKKSKEWLKQQHERELHRVQASLQIPKMPK